MSHGKKDAKVLFKGVRLNMDFVQSVDQFYQKGRDKRTQGQLGTWLPFPQ